MEDLLSLKTVLELRNLGLLTNNDVKSGKDVNNKGNPSE